MQDLYSLTLLKDRKVPTFTFSFAVSSLEACWFTEYRFETFPAVVILPSPSGLDGASLSSLLPTTLLLAHVVHTFGRWRSI